MDKKEVRLTILASALLVGAPLIVNAIDDLLWAVGMSTSAIDVRQTLPRPTTRRLT